MERRGTWEIWLVPASEHLYGEQQMDTTATAARSLAHDISVADCNPLPVSVGPAVSTPDAIRAVCRRANATPRCAGVILWLRTVVPLEAWSAATESLDKPLCYLHSQRDRTIPRQPGRRRPEVVVGGPHEPAVAAALVNWIRSSAAARETESPRVAALGESAPRPGGESASHLFASEAVESTLLSRCMSEVTGPDISQLVERYASTYDLSPEIAPGGVHHEVLREQARRELAVTQILSSGGFGAFTVSAGDPAVSGLVVQRLMEAGYGFAPGWDTLTSVLVRLLKTLGCGAGGTSFLDGTGSRSTAGMSVFGPHTLEICPSLASPGVRPRVELPVFGDRIGVPRISFSIASGRAVRSTFAPSASSPVLAAKDVLLAGHTDPGHEIAAVGAERHAALSTNLSRHLLETFARVAGIRFAESDQETSGRPFRTMPGRN